MRMLSLTGSHRLVKEMKDKSLASQDRKTNKNAAQEMVEKAGRPTSQTDEARLAQHTLIHT